MTEESTPKICERLVRDHFDHVRNYCRTLLDKKEEIDDAAQETFLTVLRHRAGLPEVRQPKAWLLKIARLTCLYSRRQRRPMETLPENFPLPAPPESGGTTREMEILERVREAMEHLPERYRHVLTIHFQPGLSRWTIAETLHVSRGALRVLFHRALSQLRRRFHEISPKRADPCVATLHPSGKAFLATGGDSQVSPNLMAAVAPLSVAR